VERDQDTGRIVSADYLDEGTDEIITYGGVKVEVERHPITGRITKARYLEEDGEGDGEEKDDKASSPRTPDEFSFASRLAGYDSLYGSAYNRGAEPNNSFGSHNRFAQEGLNEAEPEPEQQADRPARGGASPDSGRAGTNAQRRRRNLKAKGYAGQTDHGAQPHEGWYDWRSNDPTRFPKDLYDACKWPKEVKNLDTPEYQALSALCKEEVVWRNCLEDETRELFFVGPEFQSLFDQDMNMSYDSVTDSMPVGRVKVTHPVGTVTKIELIAHPDSPYTGIFRGAKHGIMRISDTTKTTPEV